MVGDLGYMDIPGIYIHNGVSKIDGQDFYDITDWGGSFIEKARAALLKLRMGKDGTGKQLVDGVSSLAFTSKRSITIEPTNVFGGQGGSGWDANTMLIRWCPDEQAVSAENWDQLNGIPAFIILGHELIHAMHTLDGSTNYKKDRLTNNAIEEARTIGLGPWRDTGLTENGLRNEWGYDPRTTFQGAKAEKILIGSGY